MAGEARRPSVMGPIRPELANSGAKVYDVDGRRLILSHKDYLMYDKGREKPPRRRKRGAALKAAAKAAAKKK